MKSHVIPVRLALVGLMGAGKSTLGNAVAHALGWPFVDADREVEERAGCTITELFVREGEAVFRAWETGVLEVLAQEAPPLVAALGGGVVEGERNRDLLDESFSVVWLQVGPETAAARLDQARDRPLLADGDPEEVLRELERRRSGWYEQVAGLRLETEVMGFAQAVDAVVSALKPGGALTPQSGNE